MFSYSSIIKTQRQKPNLLHPSTSILSSNLIKDGNGIGSERNGYYIDTVNRSKVLFYSFRVVLLTGRE